MAPSDEGEVNDMGRAWGTIEILTLCTTLFMLFAPLWLYLEHADIVHAEALALSQARASDRDKRPGRHRLRLAICLISVLCAGAFGAFAVYLAVSLSKDQQVTGLRFVLVATIVAGAVCVLENLLFAVLIGFASAARPRPVRAVQP
jgi:ABC-type uncharacterized transport system permease subunit